MSEGRPIRSAILAGVVDRRVIRIAALTSILAVALVIGKAHASFRGGYDLTASSRFGWVIGFALLVAVVAYAFGLPEAPSLRTPIRTAVVVAVVPPVIVAVIQTVIGQFVLPRLFLLLSIPANTLVFITAVRLSGVASRTKAARERIVLICSADDATTVRHDIALHSEVPCSVAAEFDSRTASTMEALSEQVTAIKPTMVVYSSEATQHENLVRMLTRLHSVGVRIRDLNEFYDVFMGKVPIRELESTSLLFDVRELHHPSYARISRMLDLAFGAAGALVLVLVVPVVALGNLIGNRGPLFYSQDRVGKGSSTFRILKFRSMLPGGTTSQWTAESDPRITRFGRLLRLSHVDELPQVLNILRGDLSLVGPRPEQPHYVSELTEKIPFYASRHLVRPGLTGWAQVNYPYGADELDAFEKLQYEFWYLRHQRVLLDLKIIARTVRHVLGFRGR